MQWLLQGHDEKQIVEALNEKYPDCSPQQILLEVANHLQLTGQVDQDVIRGWAIESTRSIYQKLIEIGDYSGALKAIKQIMLLAPKNNHADDSDSQTQG